MIGIGAIGPAGDRGPTGDHGQHGDTGDTGETGETGEKGDTGAPGKRGLQGPSGPRGHALTWVQALAMFLFVVLAMAVLSFGLERQQQRLEDAYAVVAAQQAEIKENSRRIDDARYQSCINGKRIIERFNNQMQVLADIERRNTKDPLAKERVKAYKDGVQPVRTCQR